MKFWDWIVRIFIILTVFYIGYISGYMDGYNKGYAYYKQEIEKDHCTFFKNRL